MGKRAPSKDVEIGERKWRILRMDARLANNCLRLILTGVLPINLTGILSKIFGMNSLPGIGGGNEISTEGFIAFQNDCLHVCREVKNVEKNEVLLPVILANGDWGVAEIGTDPRTVLMLVGHALYFNLSSFFVDDALKGAGEKLSVLNPSSAIG